MNRRVGVFLVAFCCLSAPAFAQGTWPGAAIWPLTVPSDTYAIKTATGDPVRDVDRDVNPDATDVSSHGATGMVGDFNSAYFFSDSTNIMFRMLLSADPRQGAGYKNYAWEVEFDSNNDNVTDWYVGVDGLHNVLKVTCNTTGTTSFSVAATPSAAAYARVVDTGVASLSNTGSNMFFIDWQAPLAAFSDGPGGCPELTPTTPLKMFFGTSATHQLINKDTFIGSLVDYPDLCTVTPTDPSCQGTGTRIR